MLEKYKKKKGWPENNNIRTRKQIAGFTQARRFGMGDTVAIMRVLSGGL
jgi:hypothetical protein